MKLFTPAQIDRMEPAQIRREYSRLRGIANKRLGNLEKHNLSQYGAYRFGKLENMFEDEVASELAEVSRFLRDPKHTVRGAKEFRADVLNALAGKPGYEDIDESNFMDWVNFMDDMRDKYGNKLFDSGDATDVFTQSERLGLPANIARKHYNYFKKNIAKVEKIDFIENAKDPGAMIRLKDFKAAIEAIK